MSFKVNRYDVKLCNSQGSFYADEKRCLEQKIVYT